MSADPLSELGSLALYETSTLMLPTLSYQWPTLNTLAITGWQQRGSQMRIGASHEDRSNLQDCKTTFSVRGWVAYCLPPGRNRACKCCHVSGNWSAGITAPSENMSTMRPAKPPSIVAPEARALPMCTTSLPNCLVSSVMQFQCLLILRGAKADSRIYFVIFLNLFENKKHCQGFLEKYLSWKKDNLWDTDHQKDHKVILLVLPCWL